MVLLDSSAWLTHLFAEPGVEQINLLFDDLQKEVYIAALSIPEVYGRLKAIGRETYWSDVWQVYSGLFTAVLPVNEDVAHQAIQLRMACPQRLPTMDGLIAAIAVVNDLMLVHRDAHFDSIPTNLLSQIYLPEK
jgi:predicted nucleic acid-binding protein